MKMDEGAFWNVAWSAFKIALKILGFLAFKMLSVMFASSICKWYQAKYPDKVQNAKAEMAKFRLDHFFSKGISNNLEGDHSKNDEDCKEVFNDNYEDDDNKIKGLKESEFSRRKKVSGLLNQSEKLFDHGLLARKTEDLLTIIRERKKQRDIHFRNIKSSLGESGECIINKN